MNFTQAVVEGMRLSYVALWIVVMCYLLAIVSLILSTICDDL
jgi:hypothetical protein